MTLADLKPGQSGKIRDILVSGVMKRRLMDMGVVVGTAVSVERVSPLGDPIEIHIKSYRLSLRKSEADKIRVEGVA